MGKVIVENVFTFFIKGSKVRALEVQQSVREAIVLCSWERLAGPLFNQLYKWVMVHLYGF